MSLYSFYKKLMRVNEIPFINTFFSIKLRFPDRQSDYWESGSYFKERYIDILFFGKPLLKLHCKVSPGDIFLERSYDMFFDYLDKMIDAGLISKLSEEDRVFEPGCNVGAILKLVAEKKGSKILGLDISKDAVEYGNKYIFDESRGNKLVAGDTLDLDFYKQFPDDYFTLSYCYSFLVHVPNCHEKKLFINELKRISKHVLIWERIYSPGDKLSESANFEDYEKEYGFKLYAEYSKFSKGSPKKVGVYYN